MTEFTPYQIRDNFKVVHNDLDYLDLKRILEEYTLIDLGYAKQSITQAKNIYLLSERGYMKLIKRTVLVRFFIAYNC